MATLLTLGFVLHTDYISIQILRLSQDLARVLLMKGWNSYLNMGNKMGNQGTKNESIVKTEAGDHKPSKTCQPKTALNKLHIYSTAELSQLHQCELLTDIQLLDSVLVFRTQVCPLMLLC